MSERANRHKAHIETDDGKHIYEGTTGDSSFHYLWNEDNDEVSLFRVKLLKNKETGVVENHAISIVDPSTGKVIGHITTGNKNLTDPTLIMSSTSLGNAVQHYAQDPATLTQSERDANVKDLTQKALAVRIKLQEQKIAMGEEMGVSKAKREKEQAELDRLKGLLTPKAPTTNGQQIAAALDATAAAIGAVAHQTAINRFKKEGGLTYRNPAAIEQVQKDERYNVEINTDGHAVVKGIKDGDTWLGIAPETQTGRKEAQQLADAIGVKIEKPSPIFETYKDALDWISEQSKKYASEKAFKATDLYKSVYEQVNLLYEQENLLYKQEKAKISAAKIKQMRDAGIDVGDKVKAFVVGSFLNGQTHYGVVVLRDGYPYVKLNEKVTVSSKGKLRDTSFVAWNDRWVKAKNEAKAAKEAAPKLAFPSPETATKDERDITVPTGMNINRDNIENQDTKPIIVRNDGKPFPTQAQAEKALEVKSKKPRRRKEKPITKDTHEVIPVDGGFAIAPVEAVTQEQVNTQADDTLVGDYAHTQLPDAVATVSKTDKGYDVDWGDEVESFTGKNAAENTQAALKKENFNKKNPDNDNGGVPVEPVAPATNSKYQNFNDFIEKIKPQLVNKKLDAAWVIAGKKIKNELPIILEQVKPYLDGVDYEQAKGSAWKTPKVVGLPDLKIDASKRELSEDAFIFLIANELNKKGLLDFNAVRTTSAQTKVEQKTNPKPAAEPAPVIDQFANNTLVTKDMAEAAIARI